MALLPTFPLQTGGHRLECPGLCCITFADTIMHCLRTNLSPRNPHPAVWLGGEGEDGDYREEGGQYILWGDLQPAPPRKLGTSTGLPAPSTVRSTNFRRL